jgi:hypothetical protein
MDKSKRSFACAIAVWLAVPATAPLAAEITLFEGPNFQGRSMTFNGEASNLDPIGFNDRAASIVVRDGVWEACADAYFQGDCAQFRPGEYPQLDRRFNHSISSLRVLRGQSYSDSGYYHRNGYPDGYPVPYGYSPPYGYSVPNGYSIPYGYSVPYRGDGYDRGYYGYPYHDHGQ